MKIIRKNKWARIVKYDAGKYVVQTISPTAIRGWITVTDFIDREKADKEYKNYSDRKGFTRKQNKEALKRSKR